MNPADSRGLRFSSEEADRLLARITQKTSKGAAGCLEWTGGRGNGMRYGIMSVRNKSTYVHRVMAAIKFGGLDDGCVVMHSCDNPACVNPDHLLVGSHLDNMSDRRSKGRDNLFFAGEANGRHKLSAQDIPIIRERIASGETRAAVARDYGVSRQVVSDIYSRKMWASVA